jgi:hypothetical protein
MLTSDAVDFFGTDRAAMLKFSQYLSKEAFDRWGVFSFRAYRLVSLFARLPRSRRFGLSNRLRRYSNKLMLYMMQTHMLGEMFVARPRWRMQQDEGTAPAESRFREDRDTRSRARMPVS